MGEERKGLFMWFCLCDVLEAGKPGMDGTRWEQLREGFLRQEACHTHPLDVVVTAKDCWVLQPCPFVFQP